MKRSGHSLVFLLGAILVPATLSARADAQEKDPPYQARPKGSLTFNKDIAPVVFKHCAACHRPGEVAPFALLSYRDVKKRAAQIQQVTSMRFMPPWKPLAGHGDFRGARRLTADQIGMLKQWTEEGAPEGEARDLPAAPKFATGWQLGEPDLVITMPAPFEVPAEGPDIYRNFIIPVQMPAGKFIRAVEYRPGNRRVVHHAILSSDTTGKARALDAKDGKAGFTQVAIAGTIFPGSMGFWVPGQEPRFLPEGVAMAWPNKADFVLQLHLHPVGKPEKEQSTIGIHFTSVPPTRSLGMFVLHNNKIDIPPGARAHPTKEERTVPADTEVYGIFPHMHLIGKDVKVTAQLPDGQTRTLLWIDRWDFNWQNYYEYATPVSLPKGTRVLMQCTHDNSAENASNPNQPPRRVTFGEQTTNEMAAVLLTTMPKAPAAALEGKGPAKDYTAMAKDVLRRFDKDKDGKLSLEEILQIPAAAGQDIPAFIRRFDRDGDGKINAEELAEALRVLRK